MRASDGAQFQAAKNCRACVTVIAHTSVIGLPGHAHRPRLGPQPRAVAFGARRVSAIAAQENAHVQLVLLAFEPVEESLDADVARLAVADENLLALRRGQLAIRRVERDVFRAGEFLQLVPDGAVSRLGPRRNCTFVEGFAFVGNHAIEIEINRVAESLAARARAVGIVEGK